MIPFLRKKRLNKVEWIVSLILFLFLGINLGMATMNAIGIFTSTTEGNSMSSTLTDNTKVLIMRADIREIKRGDIVSISAYADSEEIYLMKRIIGLPGETIRIYGEKVYINGTLLEEPYATYAYPTQEELWRELKDDEYFVMGDNRTYSGDSREYGPIPRANIAGLLLKAKE